MRAILLTLAVLYWLFAGNEIRIPDGTLLFIEGGNQIVMNYTDSVYSHVAIIFNIDGEPYVYEAIKPHSRKIKLKDYIEEISKENRIKHKEMVIWFMRPKQLGSEQTEKMQKFCETQLGRKYNVSSYLTGKSKRGIHCGELTGKAMIEGGMQIDENPCRLCPQDIYDIAPSYYHKATRK